MWRRASAWVVVVALVVAQGLPALSARHLFDDADADCGPSLSTAHPVSQFEAVHPPQADEHCAVCHFIRAVNGARPGSPAATVVASILIDAGSVARSSHYTLDLVTDTPSRAPPALA